MSEPASYVAAEEASAYFERQTGGAATWRAAEALVDEHVRFVGETMTEPKPRTSLEFLEHLLGAGDWFHSAIELEDVEDGEALEREAREIIQREGWIGCDVDLPRVGLEVLLVEEDDVGDRYVRTGWYDGGGRWEPADGTLTLPTKIKPQGGSGVTCWRMFPPAPGSGQDVPADGSER